MKKYLIITQLIILAGALLIPLLSSADNDDYSLSAHQVYKARQNCDISLYIGYNLLAPEMMTPIEYTNLNSTPVSFIGIPDSNKYVRTEYFIEYTFDSLFAEENILHCPGTGIDSFFYNLPTSIVIDHFDTGQYFIRVTALATDTTHPDIYLRSEASNIVSFVYDTENPILDDFYITDISGGEAEYTDNPEVWLHYTGSDNHLIEYLEISTASDFTETDSINISQLSLITDSARYIMTAEKREKRLFARFIDGAGNIGNGIDGSIDLYEGGDLHSYPNPVNLNNAPAHANLSFTINYEPGEADLEIFDLFGRLVYSHNFNAVNGLNDGNINSDLRWNCTDNSGRQVASGGYIAVVKIGDKIIGRTKIAVIR